MTENRANPRLRALLGARARYNQRNATLDCVIRNISDGGAMLVVSDAVTLPASFELEIMQRQRSYNAVVRWRDGTRIGVSFETDTETAVGKAIDMAAQLKTARTDNERLRNRILQLTEAG